MHPMHKHKAFLSNPWRFQQQQKNAFNNLRINVPSVIKFTYSSPKFPVLLSEFPSPSSWYQGKSSDIFNRVAMQPGEPRKVGEFDIWLKNWGKVREFLHFIQNSG